MQSVPITQHIGVGPAQGEALLTSMLASPLRLLALSADRMLALAGNNSSMQDLRYDVRSLKAREPRM